VAKKQQPRGGRPHPDLLAAAVLHTLVTEARQGITAPQLALVCERDPDDVGDLAEIEGALRILIDDGLAQHKDELFRPTHPAIRASELTF
jgi:hypothetical protein